MKKNMLIVLRGHHTKDIMYESFLTVKTLEINFFESGELFRDSHTKYA